MFNPYRCEHQKALNLTNIPTHTPYSVKQQQISPFAELTAFMLHIYVHIKQTIFFVVTLSFTLLVIFRQLKALLSFAHSYIRYHD